MKVYHATNEKFDRFDNAFIYSRGNGAYGGYFGDGFYFVDELQSARMIQSQLNARYLLTCEVPENLYDIDLSDDFAAIENFPVPADIKARMHEVAEYNDSFFAAGNMEGFGLEEYLKKAGFSGIRVLNRFVEQGLTNYVEIVIFNDSDIKIISVEDENEL